MEKNIYIFPGLANGPEHLDTLKLDGKKIIITYPNFELNEDKELYLQKIAEQITDENPIFVGFSLGGILALHVAKYKKPEIFFLISSGKERKELGWLFKFLVLVKPKGKTVLFFSKIVLMFMSPKTREISQNRINKASQNFLNLLFGFFSYFPEDVNSKRLIRIHGKKDKYFPFNKIKNPDYVLDGGHYLLDSFPDKLSEIINKELSRTVL
ncbi:MAG: alpha/beta hydrolase [Candidatus Nomurabacteria bacterium]|nr:alpha/beta hydrolase [Candidatus Nomurabacteria bacterium]